MKQKPRRNGVGGASVQAVLSRQWNAEAPRPVLICSRSYKFFVPQIGQGDEFIGIGAIEVSHGVLPIRAFKMSGKLIQNTSVQNEELNKVLDLAEFSDRDRHPS